MAQNNGYKTRLRASAVISKMTLLMNAEMMTGLGGKPNMIAMFPEIWTLMVIRGNDARGTSPISQTKIAEALGTSRQNVGRWCKSLERRGAIERVPGGYVGIEQFLVDRMTAPYFLNVVRLICAAAADLRRLYPKLKP